MVLVMNVIHICDQVIRIHVGNTRVIRTRDCSKMAHVLAVARILEQWQMVLHVKLILADIMNSYKVMEHVNPVQCTLD